jgi:DNA-binding transcriptional LysR family regulator
MDIGWDDLKLFLAVADGGSLSAAARRLKIGQPTVSRRVALLEGQLGQPLFRRGVEGAALTPAGERLLEPARRMAEWAAEAERGLERGEQRPKGIVRITAPPGVAYELLAPFAAFLRSKHPELQLEVHATVQYLDLGRREADLALRSRSAAQRDLVDVARLDLLNDGFVSPEYKRRLPRRYGLEDLDFIAWAPPLQHLPPNPQLESLIPGFRPVFTANDYVIQLRAAEAGIGAVFRAKANNRFAKKIPLVPLGLELGEYGKSSIYLVSTKSALDIPRVRIVAELLAKELELARV